MSAITGPWTQNGEVLLNQTGNAADLHPGGNIVILPHPDDELLRIGAELDEVDVDRQALLEAEARRSAARQAACRAIGLKPPADQRDTRAWAIYERRLAMVPYDGKDEADADCNERGQSIAANAIDERQLNLLGRAATITATTVHGLRVQLRALQLAMKEEFDDEAHKLLAAAMAFAGVKPALAPHHRPEPPGAA